MVSVKYNRYQVWLLNSVVNFKTMSQFLLIVVVGYQQWLFKLNSYGWCKWSTIALCISREAISELIPKGILFIDLIATELSSMFELWLNKIAISIQIEDDRNSICSESDVDIEVETICVYKNEDAHKCYIFVTLSEKDDIFNETVKFKKALSSYWSTSCNRF